MNAGRFDTDLERLPASLPVFPLAGALLLPRGKLPLNIFEPRYLAMTEDALAGNRLIGMIQPAGGRDAANALYGIGCAGRITAFTETDDGRLLITLTGVCRFGVERELPTTRGYRRVVPAWDRFAADLDPPAAAGLDRGRLVEVLKTYLRLKGISANWEAIDTTPDERLVVSLAMICPFDPPEQQALLEAQTLSDRGRLLIGLIEMSVLGKCEGDAAARH
jgi:Lon protease-like protein